MAVYQFDNSHGANHHPIGYAVAAYLSGEVSAIRLHHDVVRTRPRTITEYRTISWIIYGCVIPALIASVLYTAFILNENNAAALPGIEMRGFQFWLVLVCINVTRVNGLI